MPTTKKRKRHTVASDIRALKCYPKNGIAACGDRRICRHRSRPRKRPTLGARAERRRGGSGPGNRAVFPRAREEIRALRRECYIR